MSSPTLRRALATCLAAGLACAARPAVAAPVLELTTTVGDIGSGAVAGEYLVRVRNADPVDADGVLEIRQCRDEAVSARAPFHVPAGTTRFVRMPVGTPSDGDRLEVVAKSRTGDILARAQEHRVGDASVILFDIPPRDDQRLHELRAGTINVAQDANGNESAAIAHAAIDEATGAPVLTERATAYDGTALVLVRSSVLQSLAPSERDALLAWVRIGGLLGLAIDDLDMLSRPMFTALVGEGVRSAPAASPPEAKDGTTLPPTLAAKLVAFSGGRIRPKSFGGVAEVGLGRVFLLPLDPWSAEANGDAWIQTQLIALAASRSPRRGHRPSPVDEGRLVARFLDPNESYRSVMAIAGVILVAQAVVTALAFRRLALRRGMGPAYRLVAGASAATFAVVVGLGLHARGGLGARARELSFVEVASGEPIAWVKRYRAYYASDARRFDVAPREPSSLLTPLVDRHAVLRANDANDIALVDVRVQPWRVTTVAEMGTTTLSGGVTLVHENGEVVVSNATGGVLRNVFVYDPRHGCRAFGTIADGARARSSGASASLACSDSSGIGPAWDAYASSCSERIVQPDGPFASQRTTLVGEVEWASEPASDSGFRIEKRTTILCVVGGAP